ncbi:MAG: mechanosensitive ion channel domain-containing protein [Planctomycetota bacterium]
MTPSDFLNPFVALYLATVCAAIVVPPALRRKRERELAERRKKAGLTDDVLKGPSAQLPALRRDDLIESIVLIAAVVVTPFVLAIIPVAPTGGLAVVFLALLGWVLVTGTDVAKAFLGGLAFRTAAAFTAPFQVGDRVTLMGHSGKVTRIGILFVQLATPDGELVSLPTRALWSEVISSANAGRRSSLCVVEIFLAPGATPTQRKRAEDIVWEAMQASAYFDPTRPKQIYVAQHKDAICLTGKAYVASTYLEPDFKSEVTSLALDMLHADGIPLAEAPPA